MLATMCMKLSLSDMYHRGLLDHEYSSAVQSLEHTAAALERMIGAVPWHVEVSRRTAHDAFRVRTEQLQGANYLHAKSFEVHFLITFSRSADNSWLVDFKAKEKEVILKDVMDKS